MSTLNFFKFYFVKYYHKQIHFNIIFFLTQNIFLPRELVFVFYYCINRISIINHITQNIYKKNYKYLQLLYCTVIICSKHIMHFVSLPLTNFFSLYFTLSGSKCIYQLILLKVNESPLPICQNCISEILVFFYVKLFFFLQNFVNYSSIIKKI